MTKRILAATTALTLATTGAVWAQDGDEDGTMSVTGQAADAGEEVVDTGQAAIDAAGDAASGMAEGVEEALMPDAVVQSFDGEAIGTVARTGLDGGRVLIDLDDDIEDVRADIDRAAVSASALSMDNGVLRLDMTREEFVSALETGERRTFAN